jgi:hypothetical protein
MCEVDGGGIFVVKKENRHNWREGNVRFTASLNSCVGNLRNAKYCNTLFGNFHFH